MPQRPQRLNNAGRATLLVSFLLFVGWAQPSWSQDADLFRTQTELNALGFDAGPADGVMGQRTRAALRAFQVAEGLRVTGRLDSATLAALFSTVEAPTADTQPAAAAPAQTEQPLEPGLAQDEPSIRDAFAPSDNASRQSPGQSDAAPEPAPEDPTPVEAEAQTEAATEVETTTENVTETASPASEAEPTPKPEGSLWASLAILAAIVGGVFLLLRFIFRRFMRLFKKPLEAPQRHEPQMREAKSISPARAQPITPQRKSLQTKKRASETHAILGEQNATKSDPATIPVPSAVSPKVSAKAASKSDKTGWVPAGSSITISGRDIDGMIYVAPGRTTGQFGDPDNAFIDPSKSVARKGGDYEGDGLSYWPNYATITPTARATYLDWLSSGRSDPDYEVGYVFMYFYGLERQVFVDRTDPTERAEISQEVRRLLDIYGENYSIRRYLGAFLDAVAVLDAPMDGPQPIFEHSGHDIPFTLLKTLGGMAATGEPLSADWLLSWYVCHPEYYLRTPAKRAFSEFRALFAHLYEVKHPKGVKLRASKRKLKMQYHAASGNFTVDIAPKGESVPDVTGLSKPLKAADEIAGEATDALDKYSRYLGRNPDGRGGIEAHGLLPESIRSLFPCAELEALRGWVAETVAAGGLVPVEDLIERLEGAPPDKITKRNLTGAADALAGLGIGMAPDPRFALHRPKPGEPVILFDLPDDVRTIDVPGPGYAAALLNLTVATMVAHADGVIDDAEITYLAKQIASNGAISAAERARLVANLAWMTAVPPDLSNVRAKLRAAPDAAQTALGQIAIIAAGANGAIHPEEIKTIERLYKTMGMDAGRIYSDLHALTSSSEPVTVRPADTATSDHAIPPPPEPERPRGQVVLDAARIAAVTADTARVSQVLGDIFAGDEEDEPEETEPEPSTDNHFHGLDASHRAVATALLTRAAWTEDEFADIASAHNLMPAGALETINEWAFERFGDALAEDYDGYEINSEIADQLMR